MRNPSEKRVLKLRARAVGRRDWQFERAGQRSVRLRVNRGGRGEPEGFQGDKDNVVIALLLHPSDGAFALQSHRFVLALGLEEDGELKGLACFQRRACCEADAAGAEVSGDAVAEFKLDRDSGSDPRRLAFLRKDDFHLLR